MQLCARPSEHAWMHCTKISSFSVQAARSGFHLYAVCHRSHLYSVTCATNFFLAQRLHTLPAEVVRPASILVHLFMGRRTISLCYVYVPTAPLPLSCTSTPSHMQEKKLSPSGSSSFNSLTLAKRMLMVSPIYLPHIRIHHQIRRERQNLAQRCLEACFTSTDIPLTVHLDSERASMSPQPRATSPRPLCNKKIYSDVSATFLSLHSDLHPSMFLMGSLP